MTKKLVITPPTPEEQQAAHESFMRYLRENPNNFSYWFPHIKNLTEKGISIPYSIIIHIPEEVYKAFFREEEGDAEKIDRWVMDIVSPTIAANPLLNGRKLFIKNGTFSNKFDFSKACLIEDARDEETLIHHISNIMYDSYMHETDGYLELVVREFIEPEENTPTIYNGMPLRCEARVFYNFDTHQLLYAVNYWDWNYCHDGICFALGGERKPDADTYEKAWPAGVQDTLPLAAASGTYREGPGLRRYAPCTGRLPKYLVGGLHAGGRNGVADRHGRRLEIGLLEPRKGGFEAQKRLILLSYI